MSANESDVTSTDRRAPLHHRLIDLDERDRLEVLKAATEANAPMYAAVLSVLAAARERYEIEVPTERIAADLAPSGVDTEGVDAALEQLRKWGNVTWTQDTTRVARLEDFRRRRALWQLTAAGQAAHDAIGAVLGASDQAGSLQRTLFRDIRDNLRALGDAVDASDAEQAYLRMRDLDSSLRDLAANARDFHAAVAQLRREHDVDPDRFLAYKHRLIDYLEDFLEHLVSQRTLIAGLVGEVETRGVDRIAALAAGGDDSAGLFAGPDTHRERVWRERWRGLAGWFVESPEATAGAGALAAATTGAIRDLLNLLRRVTESARRPITRASELTLLSRWFAGLDTDAEAAELFDAAFGLGGPIHLGVPDADPDRTASNTSWWEAAPIDVAVTLRDHGKRASPGRPGRTVDYSATKARLAADHEAHRRARAEAAARLWARPIERREISDPELIVLLDLLDRAAHARVIDGRGPTVVHVEGACAELVADPAGTVVRSVRGTLTIDGHRLTVRRSDSGEGSPTLPAVAT